jgi:hypothetical protein
MTRRLLSGLVLLFLLSAAVFAQNTGKITGIVTDATNGNPLLGVNVMLEGTFMGAATDENGFYAILDIPPGVYTMRVFSVGYRETRLTGLRVTAGLTVNEDFQMEQTVLEGQSVTVVAQKPLIQKNATSSVSMASAEDLENIPVRGVQSVIATMPSVIVQDGNVHIRGGRRDEVGFYVDGAVANNVMNNANAVAIIQEAVEETQVFAGGYAADVGGFNSGVVRQNLKIGGSTWNGSFDARADGFGNAEEGVKWLDTYVYGHKNLIGTVGGPLGDRVRLFVAGEWNQQLDSQVRFSEGYEFTELIDKNPNTPSDFRGDTLNISYPDGFTPKQNFERMGLNSTVLLDIPLRTRLSAVWAHSEWDVRATPMLTVFNDRTPVDMTDVILLSAKSTVRFGTGSYLDLKANYYTRTLERSDSWMGTDWTTWYDSAAVVSKFPEAEYRNAWRSQYDYMLNGFYFQRQGAPNNAYRISKQEYFGTGLDFINQLGQHHEIKLGFDGRFYTVRSYRLAPSVMLYAAPEGTVPGVVTYGSLEGIPAMTFMQNSNLNAYGYDLHGNETSDRVDYDDGTYLDGPKKPVQMAGYLIDKIEYNDIILNIGLRFDYFDSDDYEFEDPTNPPVDTEAGVLAKEAWVKKDPYMIVSPRLGFSFPATDKTVFYSQYGQFVQMPSLENIYFGSYQMARQIVRQGYYFIDPIGFGLDPIRTTSYEIGFKQQIAENAALDLSAFYKNVKGLVEIEKTLPSSSSELPGAYERFVNGDFATTKGLEFNLTLRRTARLAGNVSYTYTMAEGTASSSTAAHGALYQNTIMPSRINPLDYAQRHTGAINLDYRFNMNEGGPILSGLGANLLFQFSSGHPYTYVYSPLGGQTTPYEVGVDYMNDTRSRVALEPLGSSTTPWTFTTDLKIDKGFKIGALRLNAYMIVNNLLNHKNVINVFQNTGSPSDDGFLSNPEFSANTIAGNGGQVYEDMYKAINLVNGQAYWDQVDQEIYGTPRQIFLGLKLSF